MALKIRLARKGAKKQPFYHIVVAASTSPRDGKFVEKIGTYDPHADHHDEKRVVLKSDRAQYWLEKGAQPTDRVQLFLAKAGLVPAKKKTDQTKQHLPRAKAQERMKNAAQAGEKPAETPAAQ